ncbi:MAG: acyltransferase family protein [Actinomycetia bacterium]|jgi:fucose 4-O-acetylase-like acetyltransferase|nr:acyltransferase family protein [Actinomycetes bacterium]
MDFLRAASITAVVFGHWFISINHWEGGVIRSTSAIGVTSGLWLFTWAFQVMPVFFFVGGFANLVAYDSTRRRGRSTWTFIRGRLERLLRPSIVFLGLWAVVQIGLHHADIGAPTGPRLWGETTLLRGMRPPGATIPFGPLWFLGVYLVVVVIAPLTIRLHRRFGLWVPLAMAIGAGVVDLVAFSSGVRGWRWLNVGFVLLFPHQLGHAYADGTLARWARRRFWAMVVGGLSGLVALTTPWLFRLLGDARFDWFPGIGHYPKSLLGTDVEAVSNAYPPTLCFLLGGVWTLGAVLLLKPRLDRWLQRDRPWRFTIVVNARIMTLFLWHMTAFLLALLLLWPLGFGKEQDSTFRWWLERPLWLVAPGLILLGLIAIFGRFEHGRTPREELTGRLSRR